MSVVFVVGPRMGPDTDGQWSRILVIAKKNVMKGELPSWFTEIHQVKCAVVQELAIQLQRTRTLNV